MPIIYKHSNFDNKRTSGFGVSVPNLKYFDGNWDNHISAIYIPEDWTVAFYEFSNFRGRKITLTSGSHNLYYLGWSDLPSSANVYYQGRLR